MRISDSFIQMTSNATSQSTYKETQTLTAQTNNRQQTEIPTDEQSPFKSYDQFGMSNKSAEKTSLIDRLTTEFEEFELEISEKDKEKIRLLEKLLESVTGRKISFQIPRKFRGKKAKSNSSATSLSENSANNLAISYERSMHYKESASMKFHSSGQIKTEDGRTIDFDLKLAMSRKFEVKTHEVIQFGGEMADPLVINFNKPSAKLSAEKISFDLIPGGELENISFVESGSGFLALDKNGDGIINDGSELFGPESGNGFLELSKYDEDDNGWIDENDPIFDDLTIWTKDHKGDNQLFGLLNKDVGAIYLGNVSTEYGLKTSGNELLGQLRSTGIFAKESGSVGTIQHVDLSL